MKTLIQAATSVVPRVSPTVLPEDGHLPAIDITTIADGRAPQDTGSWPVQFREHQVAVRIQVKSAGAVQNTVDDLAATVTAALAADETLGGTAKLCRLDEEDPDAGQLELPTGVLMQTWRVLYRVNATNPATHVS